MIEKIREYIADNNWRITICDSMINVVNFIDIISLEDDRISLKYDNGVLMIKGQSLTISKLCDKEILIVGKIKNIEFN